MDDHALCQLIASAVAELVELRAEVAATRKELVELRRLGERPYGTRLRHRGRRHAANEPNDQANSNAPVHGRPSGPECLPGKMSVQPPPEMNLCPTAAQIAQLVVAKIKPAVRAEFITETNAEEVCGQDFDWVVSVARRLGVHVANPTGRKRIIDVEVLRRALAGSMPRPIEPTEDPTTAVRRMLAERLNGGSNAAKG